jgi:hypothetical protein
MFDGYGLLLRACARASPFSRPVGAVVWGSRKG